MKTFWMPVAIGSIIVCIVLVFILHNARVVEKDEAIVATDAVLDLAECDRLKGELSRRNGELFDILEKHTAERDAARLRVNELLLERDEALADARRVSEEFAKALAENDKLRAVIEAKDDALRHEAGEINCLRHELAKARSCVKCHQSHREEPKHRRHKP